MLEKIVEICRKWFGTKHVSVVENVEVETLVKAEAKNRKRTLLDDLEGFLFARYDFRFNVLTEQTEYRRKGEGKFMQVDQRVLNTLCIDARSQGVNCWDKDVSRLLHSQKMIDFHPFLTYMAELPEWDGIDRVTELAKRISDKPLWVSGFHRWMLAMAAQWMNLGAMCQCRGSYLNKYGARDV